MKKKKEKKECNGRTVTIIGVSLEDIKRDDLIRIDIDLRENIATAELVRKDTINFLNIKSNDIKK